jgi:hypothetical protein
MALPARAAALPPSTGARKRAHCGALIASTQWLRRDFLPLGSPSRTKRRLGILVRPLLAKQESHSASPSTAPSRSRWSRARTAREKLHGCHRYLQEVRQRVSREIFTSAPRSRASALFPRAAAPATTRRATAPASTAPRSVPPGRSAGGGRADLSVKLDDPSSNAPIYANLVGDEGGETFSLVWSRPLNVTEVSSGRLERAGVSSSTSALAMNPEARCRRHSDRSPHSCSGANPNSQGWDRLRKSTATSPSMLSKTASRFTSGHC